MLGVEKVSNKIKNTINGITSGSETAKEQLVSWKIRLRSSPRMHRKGWDKKGNRYLKDKTKMEWKIEECLPSHNQNPRKRKIKTRNGNM